MHDLLDESRQKAAHHLPHDVGLNSEQFQSDSNSPESIEESVAVASPQSAQPSGPSLIQRLPLELLFTIFIQCLPHRDFHRPNRYEAPLLLTQVCTLWRKISLDTPMLWASLEIKCQSSNGGTPLLLLGDLNDLWLSRSKRYPLSLSLELDHVGIDFFVLDAIRSHSTHLRHLKVIVSESYCIFLLEDAHLPLLETFEMHTKNGFSPNLAQSILRCLTAAPRLKSFTWTNHCRLHYFPIELNWSNLTHLNLGTIITLQDCLPIFSEAKVMTHINFGFIMSAGCAVDSPIILPELQSLIINAMDDPAPIFDATTIPKLKTLASYSYFWPHTSVLAFLQRSACPLESLKLYSTRLNDAQFIECLETVQHTLKEVTAYGIKGMSPLITDAVLERFTSTGNGDVLCPKIEVISAYNSISCLPGNIAAMAQSRLKPTNIDSQSESQASAATRVLSLKMIRIYEEDEEVTYLMPLRSLGLIVKVYSSDTGAEIKTEPEDDVRFR